MRSPASLRALGPSERPRAATRPRCCPRHAGAHPPAGGSAKTTLRITAPEAPATARAPRDRGAVSAGVTPQEARNRCAIGPSSSRALQLQLLGAEMRTAATAVGRRDDHRGDVVREHPRLLSTPAGSVRAPWHRCQARRAAPRAARDRGSRRPTRASISPSVKRHATAPGTSGTVVCRRPVGTPTPIGGEEPAVTGSWASGPTTIGAGCPAVAYVSEPVSGSCTASSTVAKSPPRFSSITRPATWRAARGSRPASR